MNAKVADEPQVTMNKKAEEVGFRGGTRIVLRAMCREGGRVAHLSPGRLPYGRTAKSVFHDRVGVALALESGVFVFLSGEIRRDEVSLLVLVLWCGYF